MAQQGQTYRIPIVWHGSVNILCYLQTHELIWLLQPICYAHVVKVHTPDVDRQQPIAFVPHVCDPADAHLEMSGNLFKADIIRADSNAPAPLTKTDNAGALSLQYAWNQVRASLQGRHLLLYRSLTEPVASS